MKALKINSTLALLVAGIIAAGPVMADKPSWAGGDKGGQGGRQQSHEQGGDRRNEKSREAQGGERRHEQARDSQGQRRESDRRSPVSQRSHFEPRHEGFVRDYYGEQFRGRGCPPGLAKKHNGCMPPGQARKWQMGRTLSRDVIYYDVPQTLVLQIGLPPSGYRYVRVASDILLIAVGTGLVVDAIRDLGRL